MSGDLNGKSIVITGAGSGIGRATAAVLARKGASVLVTDVDEAGGAQTLELLKSEGFSAEFMRVDVTQDQDVEGMVRRAVELYGQLSCAVNNAGITGPPFTPVAAYTEEGWDRVMDVNLKGVWRCMAHEIRQMQSQSGGCIVNVASAAGVVAIENAAYTASKHGVVGLTRAAALNYAAQGIRVNAVCPGYVSTPAFEASVADDPETRAAEEASQPVGRLGTPEEIGETIAWLCSDASSFVHGSALLVDGGLTVQ